MEQEGCQDYRGWTEREEEEEEEEEERVLRVLGWVVVVDSSVRVVQTRGVHLALGVRLGVESGVVLWVKVVAVAQRTTRTTCPSSPPPCQAPTMRSFVLDSSSSSRSPGRAAVPLLGSARCWPRGSLHPCRRIENC